MKQKFYIDSHKAATAIVVFCLIAYYRQWQNPTAWIYLALHGSYGILWTLKSRIFPDKAWEQPANLVYGLVIWAGLTLYWVAAWLVTSRGVQAPAWYLGLCVSLYTFGVFFHFTADMQKYVALKLQPGHLITDGILQHTRNINYFGELLIYLGFGLLAMHWLPVVILLAMVVVVWLPFMLQKDRSLARYPEFAEYQAQSKLFIPFVF